MPGATKTSEMGVEKVLREVVAAPEERKKRRKKRRKLNAAADHVEAGRDCDEPLDRVVRDATDMACISQSSANVMKETRAAPSGNDVVTLSVVVKAGKLNKKKRKRLEEEQRKETATEVVSSSGDAHKRVWQYVCNRAVLVDSKETDERAAGLGSETVVTEVHVAGKKIVVTNTKEGTVAQEWLNRQTGTVFGLDAEWRPSFRKGTEHKVALLQICGESECLIVQMLYLDMIPRGLVNFLKDPAIKFPGVGIQGDAVKLKKDWGLECNGTVDLTSLAAQILGRPELKFTGLKALAKVVMDYDMAKPKRVTMSNWAKPVLDRVQVEYASLDAWVSYAIHQKLFQD